MDVFFKKFLKYSNYLFAAVSLFIFSGCTSLSLYNTLPQIDSPRMHGAKDRIGFELQGTGGKELIQVEDPSKRPLNYNRSNIKTNNVFFTRSGVSKFVHNRIAIGMGVQNSSAVFAKAKISAIGVNKDDSALGEHYLSFFTR